MVVHEGAKSHRHVKETFLVFADRESLHSEHSERSACEIFIAFSMLFLFFEIFYFLCCFDAWFLMNGGETERKQLK
jgi:hypothetical protein